MDAVEELHAARARLVTELVAGRRRVERALHDGVLQELSAFAVQLQIARERLLEEPAAGASLLDELRRDVHSSLEALRALAEDVHPPLLAAHGLAAALPGLLRGTGARLRLDAAEEARASPDAEAAAYLACRSLLEERRDGEALTVELRCDGARVRVELTPAPAPLPELARDLVEGAGGSVETAGDRLVLLLPYSRAER